MAIKFADTARPNNSANTTTKGTFPVAIASDIWFNDGDSLEEKWADMVANDTAVQVTELPTATEALDGVVYQYIGDTTDDYTNGYFYQCAIVDDGSGGTTYGWKEKEVQGGTLTVSTENGNQLQQLDDGLYVHIDDWLVDVEQLPTGNNIDDVMYRSTMGEPDIEVHYEMTSQEIRQKFEDNGFTLKSKYTTADGFAYNYIAPAGSSIQCGVKRTQNGAIVWRSFDHFEIRVARDVNETPQQIAAYSTNIDIIHETAYVRSSDSSTGFGWKCWFRDLNNITSEYIYIGNSTNQTTKRIALYDELPSSVEVSEQEGNQIQVLSDGIYVGESISNVDCIAVSAIADAEDWDEALYYYDISDGKIYQFKEGSPVEVDAIPDEIEITKELYATLSDDQKNMDVTWFVNDMENPFDQVDLTSAVVQELQEHHTDTVPTSGSANYVTSNGIYNALHERPGTQKTISTSIISGDNGTYNTSSSYVRLRKITEYHYQLYFEPLKFTSTKNGGYVTFAKFPRTLLGDKDLMGTMGAALCAEDGKTYSVYVSQAQADMSMIQMTVRMPSLVSGTTYSIAGPIDLYVR